MKGIIVIKNKNKIKNIRTIYDKKNKKKKTSKKIFFFIIWHSGW